MPYNNKTNAEYKNNYEREKYDRIVILCEKGMKDKYKEYATNAGISVNAWINKAIQEKIERDSISDPDSTDSE